MMFPENVCKKLRKVQMENILQTQIWLPYFYSKKIDSFKFATINSHLIQICAQLPHRYFLLDYDLSLLM